MYVDNVQKKSTEKNFLRTDAQDVNRVKFLDSEFKKKFDNSYGIFNSNNFDQIFPPLTKKFLVSLKKISPSKREIVRLNLMFKICNKEQRKQLAETYEKKHVVVNRYFRKNCRNSH